ncbi:MAG: PASTA domain-containing protein [bacterium]
MFSNKSGIILIILPFFSFILGYLALHLFFQKQEIMVPNVIGKDLQECIKIISDKSLSLKLLRTQQDNDLPEGIVLQQIPGANQKIRPNQNVFITISKKPKPAIAPNFIGLNQKEIIKNSKKAAILNKSFWFKSIYPVNTCISQYPEEGQPLKNQKLITYFSAGSNNLFIVPNLKDATLNDVKENLNNENISLEISHIKQNGDKFDDKNCIIIDQKPMAGSIVDMNKPLRIQLQVTP